MEPLAKSIRFQANIKGITIGTTEHKINLFANDIILMQTDHNPSLDSVSSTLDEFSHVSYYKINATKSLILPLGIIE